MELDYLKRVNFINLPKNTRLKLFQKYYPRAKAKKAQLAQALRTSNYSKDYQLEFKKASDNLCFWEEAVDSFSYQNLLVSVNPYIHPIYRIYNFIGAPLPLSIYINASYCGINCGDEHS